MKVFSRTVMPVPITCILSLVAVTPPSPAAETGPNLRVDATAGRHPISPYIYGINYAEESLAQELRLPVRRWGGNATTRYNWKNDMANHAADWYFENLASQNGSISLPDGSAANQFIEQDRRTGTRTLMTVPIIGWTPKDPLKSCGFNVKKYGAQQRTDPYWPDCGNGVKPDGKTNVTGNDPHDTSVETPEDFGGEWVRYLVQRYGRAKDGGVLFYSLDNEPDWWFTTHRDVHPNPAGYDEIRDQTYKFAPSVKAADPTALTLGPDVSVWWSYFWSAKDWVSGWNTPPDYFWSGNPVDRKAHGDVPFVEWYLQQMRAYEEQHGTRILDVLDIHGYIAPSSVGLQPAGDAATKALRLESTRAFWDPTYKADELRDYPRLIPRMHEWVNNNYPGTKTAITEYNWGALDDVDNNDALNGGLAQADILGIFGREGLDLATLWGPGAKNKPWAFAFRMFLNYDGTGSTFGDTSIRAESDDQSKLSIYAAQRGSDFALTALVINKTAGDLTSTLSLRGFAGATSAKVFRYSPADFTRILRQSDQAISNESLAATFPAYSITLFVLPAADASTALIFPHLAVGGGYATSFTLVNTGDTVADATLILTDQQGQPLSATLVDSTTSASSIGSQFRLSLPPGATALMTASLPGSNESVAGWARVDASGGALGGVATFQSTQGGRLKSIAGVLASMPVAAAVLAADYDDAQRRYVGFAVANPGAGDVHLTLVTLDEAGAAGSPIALHPLGPKGQIATFLHQVLNPPGAKLKGSIALTALPGEQFSVVALTLNQGLLTAIPVLPVTPK
jgi:hypothetical protein